MPFPERVRSWWMRATGNGNAEDARCQWRYFDASGELKQCSYRGEQVHHPIAESYLLHALSLNPNGIEGLVVCLYHHIIGAEGIYEPNGSFHPDMGIARKNYHANKNSFKEAQIRHHDLAVSGQRFWAGDDASDQFYVRVAREIAIHYSHEHPEDPMPPIPIHKKVMQPRHWYNVFDDNFED